jgi:hypothetical protein
MTGKSGPCPSQGSGAADGGMTMENHAFAKRHHHRIAMDADSITGLDFNVAIKLDMRMKMFGRLLDLDPAWRFKAFR